MIFEFSMLAYNMTMELKTKNIGSITLVELAGRMTVDNIYSLTKSIEKKVFAFAGKIEDPAAKYNSRVILDMADVEAIDSSGLGTILFLAKKCRVLGGELKIVSIRPEVKTVIEIVKFQKILNIFDTLDDALNCQVEGMINPE
jgi:anti-sigma B factor antagonist